MYKLQNLKKLFVLLQNECVKNCIDYRPKKINFLIFEPNIKKLKLIDIIKTVQNLKF